MSELKPDTSAQTPPTSAVSAKRERGSSPDTEAGTAAASTKRVKGENGAASKSPVNSKGSTAQTASTNNGQKMEDVTASGLVTPVWEYKGPGLS